MQIIGSGTVTLNESGNNVATLAANSIVTTAYTGATALTIGTVTDGPSAMTTSGITTSDDDVKLTVLAGGLGIGDAVGPLGADDISLGTGNLTLNVVGAVTQTANNVITAAGLQLLGSGTVTLNEGGNNVRSEERRVGKASGYSEATDHTISTVTDGPSGMTTSGITTQGDAVKLTVLVVGRRIGDAGGVSAGSAVTRATGNLTLNVVGAVTQTANNVITAAGLQLLGSGTVTLNEGGNNVATLAANYNGTIAYTDANAEPNSTRPNSSPCTTSYGITTSNDDVK